MIKPSQPPQVAKGKPYNRPPPVGNAPLLVLRTTFPPKGALLPALCYELIMGGKNVEWRANLPLRGGKRTKFVGSHKATENFVRRFPVERCRRQKGCISIRRSLVGMFSLRAKGAVVWFYQKRQPYMIVKATHRRPEGPI